MSLVQIMMQFPQGHVPQGTGAKSAKSPGAFMPSAPQMAPQGPSTMPMQPPQGQPVPGASVSGTFPVPPPQGGISAPPQGMPQVPDASGKRAAFDAGPAAMAQWQAGRPQQNTMEMQRMAPPQGQPMPMQPPQGMPQKPGIVGGGKFRPAPGGFRPQGRGPSFGPRV